MARLDKKFSSNSTSVVNPNYLQSECSSFPKEHVKHVRVFDVLLNFGAAAGTRHSIYIHDAEKMGVTPIMIVALTENAIFMLDWVGSHDKGRGPTRILFEFCRHDSKIKTHTYVLIHHTIDMHENGHHAKVEYSLGATHPNKAMNCGVLHHLKVGSD
jgi:hypothetical protein